MTADTESPELHPVGAAEPRTSIWRGRLGAATVGVFALAFLIAFEGLAVATVMPQVAAALDGLSWYAFAFAAPAAVAVVALTVAGPWMDRHGPAGALWVGIAVFGVGLVIAGLAGSMPVFVVGRGVQGFGGGVIGVGIYVLIAKVYPAGVQPRVFAVLTGAWVLPGLLGPWLAAQVAETFGWRWVFLGVPVIAVSAVLLLSRAMCDCHGADVARVSAARVGWAALAATGVLVLAVGGQRDLVFWPALVAGGVVAVVVAVPRLLPVGTWRGRRGLPSVLGTRGLIYAGYGAAEAYLPLALIEFHGLTPVQAGGALTAAAVTWFGGAWLSTHLALLSNPLLSMRTGLLFTGLGVLATVGVLDDAVPGALFIAAWALAGLGMGLGSPSMGVLVLRHSPPDAEGASGSAAQLNDAITTAVALAVGGVLFAVLLPVGGRIALGAALAVPVGLLLLAWLPLRRIGETPTP